MDNSVPDEAAGRLQSACVHGGRAGGRRPCSGSIPIDHRARAMLDVSTHAQKQERKKKVDIDRSNDNARNDRISC